MMVTEAPKAIYSSYAANGYGAVFTQLIESFRPMQAVELGVLYGYSTVALAEGLRRVSRRYGHTGHLNAYDLFDEYPYRHGSIQGVKAELFIRDLEEYVTLVQADAFSVHDRYERGSVTFLHVDLSNTGEVVRRIMAQWDEKVQIGGLICFEGGTEERDQVGWIKKYGKEPMQRELETNSIITSRYVMGTYLKFPGLTTLLKKR